MDKSIKRRSAIALRGRRHQRAGTTISPKSTLPPADWKHGVLKNPATAASGATSKPESSM